ncbi:MAG: endonuclease/exonuclease/phosphatase family protein [Oscillospiraceae bacterium]
MSNDFIKILSFNLKRDGSFTLRNIHKWRTRREIAAQVIRENDALIVGVQELLPFMRDDVSRLLDSEYSIVGAGRLYGKRLNDDEHSDIIIKNEDTEIRFMKTFWLSKHPERLSRAYYAFFPRICTVAEVYIKPLDQTIRVFNTHLDHICSFARLLSVHVILDYMEQYNQTNPMPTVLMGDFNCKSKSKPVQFLRENTERLHLTDVYSRFDPSCLSNTLHNFSGRVKPGASPIDYIFVSDDFDIVDSKILTDSVDGCYPSDHYPLLATLKLKRAFA